MATDDACCDCYRRFARKFNSDHWLNLVEAQAVSDKALYDRLKSNWAAVGSVSGLVSGFTYIASNNDIQFTQSGPFSEHRIHLFGLLSMLAFIISLQATLFSSSLFGMINLMGVENINWFVRRNWWLLDLPLILCATSIGLMLLSALVSIGGIVYEWVYWIIFAVGLCTMSFFVMIYLRIQRQMYARTVYLRDQGAIEVVLAGDSKKNDDYTPPKDNNEAIALNSTEMGDQRVSQDGKEFRE